MDVIGGSTQNLTDAVLYGYPDSYIDFTYSSPVKSAYGVISITRKSDRFNDISTCTGHVLVPDNVNVSDMKITSYSGNFWTDYVSLSNSIGSFNDYSLWSQYPLIPYPFLGDPFVVNIADPWLKVKTGEVNDITVWTGNSKEDRTNCSADNRAIYALQVKSLVGYGGVYPSASGCSWDIEFDDGTMLNGIKIPEDYSGSDVCQYTSANVDYVEGDAVNDAMYRMFSTLDLDDDGCIDILFDPSMVEFKTTNSGGIQSLWGPTEVKLVVWM